MNNLVRAAKNFGKQEQVSNFVTLSAESRFASGARFAGGVDFGRTVTDSCFVVDSPQQLVNCRVAPPFFSGTQIKLNGSYPLPGDVFVSGVFQTLPGPSYTADWAAPVAVITPSLAPRQEEPVPRPCVMRPRRSSKIGPRGWTSLRSRSASASACGCRQRDCQCADLGIHHGVTNAFGARAVPTPCSNAISVRRASELLTLVAGSVATTTTIPTTNYRLSVCVLP